MFNNKIMSNDDQILKQIAEWKSKGEKVVFTNGVFDIIHIGHVSYLEEARSLGDRLVVGINSDISVTSIKGPTRPVKDELNRLGIVAAMESVDMVILFSDDTPIRLLHLIKPDVLVKGGNYTIDKIVGFQIVLDYGGEVQSLLFKEGYSSTALIKKIIKGG